MAVSVNAAVSGQTSDTDSSGTLTEMNVLTGVDGQEFFCTTYNHTFRWVNGRWFPTANIDPRYGFMWQDEFLGAIVTGAPWNAVGSVGITTATATEPGGWTLTRSAGSQVSAIYLASGNIILLGSMDLYMEGIIRLPLLATAGEDYCVSFGLNDNASYSATGLATDGVYLQYNRGVTGDFWGTRTVSNGTPTANTSAIAATAATVRLGIYINNATTAKFYVNGVKTGTDHTLNIPTGSGRHSVPMFKIDKIAGSAASDLCVDHFTIYGFFSIPRSS
jgi:hypothetical protein